MRCAAGVNSIKEKGKDTNKKKKIKEGESMLGQLAQPGEQGSRTPQRRGRRSPLTQVCGGCPAPAGGSADPQKFAAGVQGGARRAG